MAEIFSICYQVEASVDEAPYQFSRVPTNSVTLVAGHGIEGDRKAGHNPKRHLNIMSQETLQVLADEGFRTNPGEMGEQLIIKGLDVASLEPGTEISIGEQAVVRVNSLREPCDWFAKVQGKSAKSAEGRVGVMASVMTGGRIRLGDRVRVVKPVSV